MLINWLKKDTAPCEKRHMSEKWKKENVTWHRSSCRIKYQCKLQEQQLNADREG